MWNWIELYSKLKINKAKSSEIWDNFILLDTPPRFTLQKNLQQIKTEIPKIFPAKMSKFPWRVWPHFSQWKIEHFARKLSLKTELTTRHIKTFNHLQFRGSFLEKTAKGFQLPKHFDTHKIWHPSKLPTHQNLTNFILQILSATQKPGTN